MREDPLVSIVIPVWRDEGALTRALERLVPNTQQVEIIAAGVLGEEQPYAVLRERHPDVRWVSAPRGRASQMSAGAAVASGRWLLFLHADSQLPPDWLEVLRQADASAGTVMGAFRFALDSSDWRARVIETGVRLRVALFGLPYGDQALFVRNQTFRAIGGYRDLPLMEDVDLVRRIRKIGRLVHSPSPVLTSARRWERDGWLRRSAQNARLAIRFLFGAPPARLAQQYFGRKPRAVVVMARAPWTGGKTRLDVTSDDAAHAELRHALFLDTLDVVTSVNGVEHVVACEPAAACERMREFVGSTIDVIPQRGVDLGQRMAHVFEDVSRLGVESIVVVGSDLPDLPARLLDDAFRALRDGEDRLVLGPSTDGGYYLIGMNRLSPSLFDLDEWSTDGVFDRTVLLAKTTGLQVVALDRWTDVDGAADLNRLAGTPSESAAVRTRAWLSSRVRSNATRAHSGGGSG
jgi:rSAM/selenodomain-associated transferase 2/rSAM/selenodomain-associated transferase 1